MWRRKPAYPRSAALHQAKWLAEYLGEGWKPKVGLALVDRGVSTTDPDRYTFWAEKGTVRVVPEQPYKARAEYAEHDLALLAAEALVYNCEFAHPEGTPKFGAGSATPRVTAADPREALRTSMERCWSLHRWFEATYTAAQAIADEMED